MRLSQAHTADPIQIPRKLAIWPRHVGVLAIRPNASTRWRLDEERYSETEVENAIAHVVLAAESIEHASGDYVRRRATAERLVLSGGLLTTRNNLIQSEAYSPSLARSVAAAVAEFRRAGVARPEKLDALVKFMKVAGKEHVLVFCVHRAVARAVSQVLNQSIGAGSVRTAIGAIDKNVERWFNEITHGETRVLVATDACSESI